MVVFPGWRSLEVPVMDVRMCDAFRHMYMPSTQDFGKPGCSMHAATRHQAVQATLVQVELQQNALGGTMRAYVVHMTIQVNY